MRARLSALAAVCLVAMLFGALAGCDADQPAVGEGQVAELNVEVRAAVQLFDVWERFIDVDLDGVPDEFDPSGRPVEPPLQVQCKEVVGMTDDRLVPWFFGIQVSLLRNGESVPVPLTNPAAAADNFNLSPLDNQAVLGQQTPPCAFPESCEPLGRLSAANRTVIESAYIDLQRSSDEGGTLISGLFRCPGTPDRFGEPSLGGDNPLVRNRPPLIVQLEKGDTLIVKIALDEMARNGLEILGAPAVTAFLRVNGQLVTPVGTTQGDDGVSFSFTLQ